MVGHTFHPSTHEAEAGRSTEQVPGQAGHTLGACLQIGEESWICCFLSKNPSTWEAEGADRSSKSSLASHFAASLGYMKPYLKV